MRLNLVTNYFSKLLNSSIDENTILKLSSGQRARAHAWLKANNFNLDGINFNGGFTIANLMSGLQSYPQPQTQQEAISTNSDAAPSALNTLIGIDIQSISELFPDGMPSDPKSDPELLAIFTFKELSYAQTKLNPIQTLTGLFAAKEAILKCSKAEISLAEVEILPGLSGGPYVEGYSISISHSQDYAVAIAISNLQIYKDSKIKETYKDYNNNSGLRFVSNGSPFINYLVPIIVLGLVCIELIRFLS